LAIASCNLIKSEGSDSADIEEAEMLARKAVHIMKKLGDPGGDGVRWTFGNLVIVLFQKEDFGDETLKLFENFLNETIKDNRDNEMLGSAHSHLGSLHFKISQNLIGNIEKKRRHLILAKSHCNEAIRFLRKFNGGNDLRTTQLSSLLLEVIKQLQELDKLLLSRP
jgi:hypothetical protein